MDEFIIELRIAQNLKSSEINKSVLFELWKKMCVVNSFFVVALSFLFFFGGGGTIFVNNNFS